MNPLKKSEIIGTLVTIIAGFILHFTYELSGENTFAALFSPVNESTWEHLKLLFFPYVIFTIVSYFYVGKTYANFATAKCIGVLAGLCFIPLFFYLYTLILGTNYLLLDIAAFMIAVIISYLISYKISVNGNPKMNLFCIVLLFFITMLFFVFTFYPPHTILFLDPTTNSYAT